MKKEKVLKISLWVGLAVLVLVVIITSIIVHQKNKELEDLKEKNEIVKPEEPLEKEENKIFFKNFEIFIDNDLIF